MDFELTTHEARVLGVLIEKELTTPEYYPLSLNALTAGCNQKSSREPVMQLTEEEVSYAATILSNRHVAWKRTGSSRVVKYEHNLYTFFGLSTPQVALLSLLLLRGAQTAGELRSRSERMHEFTDVDAVVATLSSLKESESGESFVVELPRAPGKKESRYAHALSGVPALGTEISESERSVTAVHVREEKNDRIVALEERVATLEAKLTKLCENLGVEE